MNVFSAFDGNRSARLALRRAGVRVDKYYSSEIDKYALAIANKNFPDLEKYQLGDINKVDASQISDVDLFVGGSPCTSFSKNGKMKGFDGASGLFWRYAYLLKKVKPKYFILENVAMKQEWQDVISEELGVKPLAFDSRLVSAQKRPRLYWTNIPNVISPADREVFLSDIISGEHKIINDHDIIIQEPTPTGEYSSLVEDGTFYINSGHKDKTWCSVRKKMVGYTTAKEGDSVNLAVPLSKTRRGRCDSFKTNTVDTACAYGMILDGNLVELNINDFEVLQNLPKDYTQGVSLTQRKKMIGNGFTVDMVAHIASFIKD